MDKAKRGPFYYNYYERSADARCGTCYRWALLADATAA